MDAVCIDQPDLFRCPLSNLKNEEDMDMRIDHFFILSILSLLLSGCAAFSSPASWGWDTGHDVTDLEPALMQDDADKRTADDLLVDAQTLDGMLKAIGRVNVLLSKEKSEVRKKLDEASGGNYGWGILGVGAAVAKIHESVLKGIAVGAGSHVALSTRLSPSEQLSILSETMDHLVCVQGVAMDQQRATKPVPAIVQRLSKNNTWVKSALNGDSGVTALGGLTLAGDDENLAEYRLAVQSILFAGAKKMDVIYTSAAARTAISTDIQTSINTFTKSLKSSDSAAEEVKSKATEDVREKIKAANDNNEDIDVAAQMNALQSFKALVDLVNNANEVVAAVPTKLAACQ